VQITVNVPVIPMNNFWNAVKHYAAGLVSSCWDAGITSIKLLGGVAVAAAAAPQTLSQLDLKHMAAVFVAAAFWQGIDYFDEHKIEKLVEDTEHANDAVKPAAPVAQA
jgi:hypothetical protein